MIYWRGSITIHRIVIRAFQLRAPYTWINAVEFNKHFSNISLVLTIQLSIMLSSQLLLLATLVASISVITAKDLNWTIQNKPFKVCIKPGTLERGQIFSLLWSLPWWQLCLRWEADFQVVWPPQRGEGEEERIRELYRECVEQYLKSP